ncbi:MAG: hypothetical protein GVY36_11755 [Verrucomicrobia bacterium]|nr:hypothetical protein [Verrucomicrobiota bacterium]
MEKPGYYPETISVFKGDPRVRGGQINISLEEDEAYTSTTTSDATNKWLRVQVNASFNNEPV